MVEAGQDNRRLKRAPFIQDVEVIGVGMRRCSDIGAGGMYLDGVDPFPIGALHKIRFKLQNSDPEPMEIQIRVLYVHPGVGSGFGFVDLDPDIKNRIENYVSQNSA